MKDLSPTLNNATFLFPRRDSESSADTNNTNTNHPSGESSPPPLLQQSTPAGEARRRALALQQRMEASLTMMPTLRQQQEDILEDAAAERTTAPVEEDQDSSGAGMAPKRNHQEESLHAAFLSQRETFRQSNVGQYPSARRHDEERSSSFVRSDRRRLSPAAGSQLLSVLGKSRGEPSNEEESVQSILQRALQLSNESIIGNSEGKWQQLGGKRMFEEM